MVGSDIFDQPPAQEMLDECEIVTRTVGPRDWLRIHRRAGHAPAYYNNAPHGRWNAVEGEYGVLYLGQSFESCFLEVSGTNAWKRLKLYHPDQDAERVVSVLRSEADLVLADITQHGMSAIGMRLPQAASEDWRVTRAWAARIYHHSATVDGIYYRCKANPALYAAVIFDRGSGGLGVLESAGLRGQRWVHDYEMLVDKYRLVSAT